MSVYLLGLPQPVASDLSRFLGAHIATQHAMNDAEQGSIVLVSSQYLLQPDAWPIPEHLQLVVMGKAPANSSAYHCPLPCKLEMLRQLVHRLQSQQKSLPMQDGWVFYPQMRQVKSSASSEVIGLTDKEAGLLECLYLAKGSPISKETLLATVWEYETGVDTHTVETHIYRLRNKLKPCWSDTIELKTTEHGYALVV